MLIIFFVVIILCYLIAGFLRNRRIKTLTYSIPGPRTVPFFGSSLEIARHSKGTLDYLVQSQKKYGCVMKHVIGSYYYVFLSDPKDVEVLMRDTVNIRKSWNYDLISEWLGQGLITSTGTHWHSHRKIITPAYHFNILEKFVDVFDEKANILINILSQQVRKEAFDIYPYLNRFALDTLLETSMGKRINAQEDENCEFLRHIHTLTEVAQKRIYNPLLRYPFIFHFTALKRRYKNSINYIHNYCKKVTREKQATLQDEELLNNIDEFGVKKRVAFLDLLILGQRAGNGFTEKDILDEVNTFMFAGEDTISSALAFAIHKLAYHPDVQQKAYEEIVSLFDSPLTLKNLQSTQYLDQVINETLRLCPSVVAISRLLNTDLKIREYTIPKGATVSMLIYMLHRHPKYFPDPEVFDPDRFSPENTKSRHPYVFLPFSGGLRNCIGKRYANLQLKVALIKILRNYRILPGEDIENYVAHIILHSSNGMKIRLENRKK